MIVSMVIGSIAFRLIYSISTRFYQIQKVFYEKLLRDQLRKHEHGKTVLVCSFYGDSQRSNGRSAFIDIISMLHSEG